MTGEKQARGRRRESRHLRHLSQAVQLEEAVNPRLLSATLIVVSLAIVVFVAWAALTNINEVARTSGEVVPQGFTQSVQHLEGGLIKAIHVDDGDIVAAGAVLVELDEAVIRDDIESASLRLLSLTMRAERLRAFAEGREPDAARFPAATPAMIRDSQAFFSAMRLSREREAAVIGDQIRQRERQLRTHEADLTVARSDLALA